MLRDKIKDSKTKQKLDLLKSAHNLSYLLEPENKDAIACLRQNIQENGIEPIQTVYQKEIDTIVNKYYLKTKHNQLKNNHQYLPFYRSPYTNKYNPALTEKQEKQGIYPSPLIRNIQEKGEILFTEYAKMYYGEDNCVANFFVEENQEDFCFAFYVQKDYTQENKNKNQGFTGIWNSTNIAEIKGDPSKNISYKVTTSVIYELKLCEDENNEYIASGNIKKIKSDNKKPASDAQIDQFHLSMIGKIIQENQSFLWQQIQSVFIKKTKDIIHKTRITQSNQILQSRKKFNKALFQNKQSKTVVKTE